MLFDYAGRAAEELIYGEDEMSTINQRRIVMARRIVQKLTVASAMVDNPAIGPRTISTPVRRGGGSLKQVVTNRVSFSAVQLILTWTNFTNLNGRQLLLFVVKH